MIPYEELDRALSRWKARSQNVDPDAARAFEERGAATPAPLAMEAEEASAEIDGLPAPPDRTGEIDLGDAVVETYEDDNR
jgi:hypothetical protein